MRVALLAPALLLGCNPTVPIDVPADGCEPVAGHVCTVVGDGGRGYNGDGLPATETLLYFPTALAFDDEDRLVFVDFNNQRIRRVEHDGTVATLVGNGVHAYAVPGEHALQTALENPVDLALLPDGRMLIAELHAGRVLEIDDASIVRTYAGSGFVGYDGDGGPAHLASLSELMGLALAPDGTVFVADTDNHCIRTVSAELREIDGYPHPTRVIEGLSGDGSPGHRDGEVGDALFSRPHHMLWHDDALFVADTGNHRVRRLDLATGEVTTLAGDGTPGYAGDGGPAIVGKLREPTGLVVDDDGSIYVADSGNHVVRVIAPDGTLSTVAGQVVPDGDGRPEGAFGGDGGPAVDARFFMPQNLTIGPDGHLYVADTVNSTVRVIFR